VGLAIIVELSAVSLLLLCPDALYEVREDAVKEETSSDKKLL
jgi:hypothetical protein